MRKGVAFALLIILSGCATSKVSTVGPGAAALTHAVNEIAMAPGGGLLADAVGVELANRGYVVIDPASTSNLLVRLNLSEVEIAGPAGLARLGTQGVDAYLTVRSAGTDRPDSASARLTSTRDGRLITGVTWQNGWGGQAGSMADRTMRKGLAGAAREIAAALAKALPPP